MKLSTNQGHEDRSFRGCHPAVLGDGHLDDVDLQGAVKAVATAFAEGCWLQTSDQNFLNNTCFEVTEGLGEDDEVLFVVDMTDWPEGEGFGDWFYALMREHGVEVWD